MDDRMFEQILVRLDRADEKSDMFQTKFEELMTQIAGIMGRQALSEERVANAITSFTSVQSQINAHGERLQVVEMNISNLPKRSDFDDLKDAVRDNSRVVTLLSKFFWLIVPAFLVLAAIGAAYTMTSGSVGGVKIEREI